MKFTYQHPLRSKEGCFSLLQYSKRAILFVNGDLPRPDRFRSYLLPDDILIAVDGGLRYLTTFNLIPDFIIGDLDSADPEEVNRLQSQGVKVHRFPIRKDATDLELALEAAVKLDVSTIWIAAALGNRIDQTLGNIFLLTQPELASLDVRLVDGIREVFLIRDEVTIKGFPGQTVSLLPLLGPVSGVTTFRLAYPLNHETLYPYHTRGISNVMLAETAAITIEDGTLLCIHTFNETNEMKGD